jgi:hypothetical protein
MGRPAYWTEERVREIAKNYEFISDLAKNHPGAHAAIKNRYRHLKEELFPVNKQNIWTYDAIKEEALKYKTRTEFKDCANGAYSRAAQIKVLDDVCSHMVNSRIKGKFDLGFYEGISGLYVLYKNEKVVYIGKSFSCVVGRIRDHYKDKDFDGLEIYPIESCSNILLLEMWLIMKHKPEYNIDYVFEEEPDLELVGLETILTSCIKFGASFGTNMMNSYKGK